MEAPRISKSTNFQSEDNVFNQIWKADQTEGNGIAPVFITDKNNVPDVSKYETTGYVLIDAVDDHVYELRYIAFMCFPNN
jgi:hypothetical protein